MRRALVRVIRFCIDRPVAFFGGLVAVLVVVGAIVLIPMLLPSLTLPGVALSRGAGTPPTATEDYLRGNQNYDAQLMWDSLSSDAQQQLTGQGGSATDLDRQMQAAKDRGAKLEEFSYIGGKPLPDGSSVQFYLVGIQDQPQASVDYQPYMFTLDRTGKITKVQ
ncbi:MAG: hypothetical protein JO023_03140 [Chloroflexi bacterium]|nr:hypothetical protein [Chloroflexota bacterium]